MANPVVVGGITIYEGVAASVLAQFPDQSFDAIITDPPETVRSAFWIKESFLWRYLKPTGTAIVMMNPVHGWYRVPKADIFQAWEEPDPRFAPCAEHGHPHSRPLEMVSKLVAMTEGTILDPYCGAGSTLVAAALDGRQAVGIDFNAAHVHTSAARVTDALNIVNRDRRAYDLAKTALGNNAPISAVLLRAQEIKATL